MARILITGSAGVVGSALQGALRNTGHEPVPLDVASTPPYDVTDRADVDACMAGCDGVIHLAAVSRVVWGQRAPLECDRVNVSGTANVLRSALSQKSPPWVIFASSREVYGDPARLPATEDAPLAPLNVYARSKVQAESMMAHARQEGLRTVVLRLSNVYGAPNDHEDRVVPAFAKAALTGQTLRVDGRDHTFDFCHVSDAVDGFCRVVAELRRGRLPPTLHLTTGVPTRLGELAELAVELAGGRGVIREATPRDYDVSRFWGDPSRAFREIGWRAAVPLPVGLRQLMNPGLQP